MSEERIIINKALVIERFDKAGDPMVMWCILKADGEFAAPKGWTPLCFIARYGEDWAKCNNPNGNVELEPCLSCPFPKSRTSIKNDIEQR